MKNGKNWNKNRLRGDYTVETILEINFLNGERHLWNNAIVKEMFRVLKQLKSRDDLASNERCFTEFLLEVEQAYRDFLCKIKELPMIMKCRTMGDQNSHFGGEEFAQLMKAFRFSSEKYLNQTAYKDEKSKNSLYYVISKIRDRAKSDEKSAWEIERQTRKEYESSGNDGTMKVIERAGYGVLDSLLN